MAHTINVDEKFLQLLEDSNIFQVRTQMKEGQGYINRFKVGDRIQCSINACIEEYSSFGSGYNFFSSGAFSSLASALPINSRVGRYTSFAVGYKSLGYRHPVAAVCMNAISYDFRREHLLAYLGKYEKEHGTLIRRKVPNPQPQRAPFILGNDVWVGANVTIVGGVKIGNGAVIAGGSVVTKDVAPYSIIAGIPAKHKKFRFPQEIIVAMEEIKWWEYELGDLYREGLDFADPDMFIKKFYQVKNSIRNFDVRLFFPYLYNFGLDLSPKNLIGDFHGNLLYYDFERNKILQKKTYESNLVPIRLKQYKDFWYLYIEGIGLLNIDANANCSIVQGLQDIEYTLVVKADNKFYLSLNGRHLCAEKDRFIWKSCLLEWEHFYSFLDLRNSKNILE